MFKLLMVEDEFALKELASELFTKNRMGNYKLDIANDFYEGIDKLRSNEYDLMILDCRITAGRSKEECGRYRKYCHCKVILIMDLNEDSEVACAEFITPDGLVIRATAEDDLIMTILEVLKEARTDSSKDMLEFGGIRIELLTNRITIDGKPADLTPTAYKLLCILIENRGKILGREYLLKKVWGDDYCGNPRVVDNQIRYLRRFLGRKEILIRTVKGKGYIFGG